MTPDLELHHYRKGCRFDFAPRYGVVSLAPFDQEPPMKTTLIAVAVAVAVLLMLGIASAQQKTHAATSTSEASVLEGKVRKGWEDFKTKNKPISRRTLPKTFTRSRTMAMACVTRRRKSPKSISST